MALTEARIVAAEAAAVGLTLDWQMVLRTQPAREVPLEEVLTALVGHGKDFRRDYRITVPLERGLILIRPHGSWMALVIEDDDVAAVCRNFLVEQGARWHPRLPSDPSSAPPA